MFEDLQNLGVLKKEGYRINLKNIAKEDLNLIKKQLTLVPKVHKDFVKNVIKYKCFSINKKYIYLPKYWALEKIGEPKKNLLKRGEYFNKKLETIYPPRPFQVEIIDKTYKQLKEIGGGIITVSCGQGKCLGEDTPILMYDGKIKMVQDVKVGDKLMGDDSTPRNVLSLARGREMMYKIIPKRGNSYIVNESHILSLKCSTKCRFGKKNDVFDIPLKDYLKLPKSYLGKGSSICGYKVPVEFQEKEVDMDPYIIGLWLGDGTSSSSGFTTNNHQMIHYLHKNLPKYDMYLEYSGRQYDYRITNDYSKTKGRNLFNKILRKYNLFKNKHIPDIYKCNSRENRLKLLAGLLDTDGSLEQNIYNIGQKNEKLLDDIVYLCLSLGFYAHKREVWKRCTNGKNKEKKLYYTTSITGFGIEEIPIIMNRKKSSGRKQIKNPLNSLITVEKLEVGDYYGFQIDGNSRFLLGDFTVTHNTFMAINLATLINQKTLIMVHTSVLLDQWIDRIKYFIPNARIGKIQGKKFDIENKDYVIAMLQTVVKKSKDKIFTEENFKSFGLTIYDECFPFSQYILTENGPIKIGTIYEKWKNKKILPKVKSYNEKTKKYEYKKITYAFRKENSKLLKISIGKKKIKCTENHKFLTLNGYKEAKSLTIEDLLISNYDGYGKISKIENIINTGYGRCNKPYVYDIEVEDNHNFIVCGNFTEMGVVVHNCHHMAAPSFSKAFPIISSKYNLGLSATPKRSDNLQNIFYWNIGPTSFESFTNDKFAIVKNINFTDDNYVEKYNWKGSIDLHKLHLQIIENDFRNKMIIKQLVNLSKKGRQILVLSKMINHLRTLKTNFCKKKYYKNYPRKTIFEICKNKKINKKCFSLICSFIKIPVTCGYYIGGMKQSVDQSVHSKTHRELDQLIFNNIDKIKTENLKYIYNRKNELRKKINLNREDKINIVEEANIEIEVDDSIESLEKSSKCDILFASYQLVSEGTDIPTLNTLIMTTPKKQIEQVIGRILRSKTEFTPLILDIVDSSFSVYQNQSYYRNRYYRKCNYSIEDVNIDTKDKKIPIVDEEIKMENEEIMEQKCDSFFKCLI